MKLIGQGNVYQGKSYSVSDSNGKGYSTPQGLGYDDTWYGGMVKKIFTSKDGVYILCDKKDNVINIGIPDKPIIEDDKQESDSIDLHELSRKELLELAKKLDIEGKFATIKTEELIEKIKEAQSK